MPSAIGVTKGKLVDSVKELTGRFKGKHSQFIEKFFTEDVTAYLEILKVFDEKLRKTTNHQATMNDFRSKTEEIVQAGEELLANQQNDRRTEKLIKETFRELLYPWYDSNPFIQRGLWKPRGYPGDYMMMEMGYRKETSSLGGLAGQFDFLFFDRYQSILNRKEIIKAELRAVLASGRKPLLNVLTLGGGSSREWLEFDLEISREDRGRIKLTYLDQDEEALSFSRQRVQQAKLIRSAEFFGESLLQFRNSREWASRDRSYEFVYALGIADYFPDGLLIDICRRALNLVRPGGSFLITHKDDQKFNFPLLDWICDWRFVHRDADVFNKVVAQAIQDFDGEAEMSIKRDATDEILFIKAKRLA